MNKQNLTVTLHDNKKLHLSLSPRTPHRHPLKSQFSSLLTTKKGLIVRLVSHSPKTYELFSFMRQHCETNCLNVCAYHVLSISK